MSSSDHEAVAKVDLPYHGRDLPLAFLGVKHTKWTKTELVEVIETLGGTASTSITKIDLFEAVHLRYNPRKILQRTINALEVIAQAVAGQNQRSQAQVRKAAQDATRERADLARERRGSAKRRGGAMPGYEPAPTHRAENSPADGDQELKVDEDPDWGDDDPILPRRLRFAAPQTGTVRQKRKAKRDLEDSSDVEIVRVVRRAHLKVDSEGPERGRVDTRKRWARVPLDNDRAKRRKANVNLETEAKPPGHPAIVFGASTAIRDDAAFGVGLQPINYGSLAEWPSCQVCSDALDPLFQFQVSVASQCNHAPEICLACWEQHIAVQADTKSWDSITCPHADCGGILDHGDMQRFAPRDVFRRYDRFETNKALQNVPGYRLCAHEGCGSGGFVEVEPVPTYMTCADCQRHTCLGCNLVYHHGQTCEEYRAWLADAPTRAEADEAETARLKELEHAERKSAKYLDKRAKICPNGACGAVIQKTTTRKFYETGITGMQQSAAITLVGSQVIDRLRVTIRACDASGYARLDEERSMHGGRFMEGRPTKMTGTTTGGQRLEVSLKGGEQSKKGGPLRIHWRLSERDEAFLL